MNHLDRVASLASAQGYDAMTTEIREKVTKTLVDYWQILA